MSDDTPAETPAPSSRPTRLSIIVAVAANGVIGARNALPWRIPEDLKRFRALTTGHAVIMGRKTWESLPRALPDRQNIVVTRQSGYVAAGAETAPSLAVALSLVRLPLPAYCIGGAELYAQALPLADELQVTEIAADFDGDTRMPPLDHAVWTETARVAGQPGAGIAFGYAFVTYRRGFASITP